MANKDKLSHNESRFSSLVNCIKKESIEELKDILEKWSSVLSLRDKSNRTALHYCSDNSSALCADLLLQKRPQLLTVQDNDGYTALHLSVINGNQTITRYLLSKNDVNLVDLCDNESHTAIHWATVCGELDCLDLLLNCGAQASRADIHGAYPIHYSAQMCSPHSGICVANDSTIGLALLNRLLQSPDVDVNCVDSDNRTPLLWAASTELRINKISYSSGSSSAALLTLINAGANVAATDKDGLTALHCASSRGHIDCVETLLTLCGADVNQMDVNGCPPLFYAVTLGHADCTRLLIESGADVNLQDYKGRTAAHCGAARGQLETIKILGQHKANLWLRNIRGDLPLHEAVKSGRKELVKWLLDQQPAAVNATNSFGRSALHIAAINNNIEMSKILLDFGADVNTVMKLKGHFITPLDAALQKGHRSVAKYLLLHEALPASRISQPLNNTNGNRYLSDDQQIDGLTAFESSSPFESLEDWKVRADSSADNCILHPQTHPKSIETSSRTQLPKLPSLVSPKGQTPEPNTSAHMESGNHYRNVREFETPLMDRPSNLKQAIITNVYVTNNPIVHSKRVPPLKKPKKKSRKALQDNDDSKAVRVYTPSMSSSSSLYNGDDSNVRVVLETKDNSNPMSDKELEEFYLNNSQNKQNINSNEQNITFNEQNNVISDQTILKESASSIVGDIKSENNDKNEELSEMQKKEVDENIGDGDVIKDNLTADELPKINDVKARRNSVMGKSSKTSTSQKSSADETETKKNVRRDSVRRRSSISVSKDINIIKSAKRSDDISDKEILDQSLQVSANSDKEKQKKIRAKKDFSEKINEFKDMSSAKSVEQKSDELNSPNDILNDDLNKSEDLNETINEKVSDKSVSNSVDRESLKSSDNTSDKENIMIGKSDSKSDSEKQDTVIESQTNVTNDNQITKLEKSSEKEEMDEYDEYVDRWESDSEVTVINSDNKILTEDINNNYIGKTDPTILTTNGVNDESKKLNEKPENIKTNTKEKSNTDNKKVNNKPKTQDTSVVKQTNGKLNDNKKIDRKASIKSNVSSKGGEKVDQKKPNANLSSKRNDTKPLKTRQNDSKVTNKAKTSSVSSKESADSVKQKKITSVGERKTSQESKVRKKRDLSDSKLSASDFINSNRINESEKQIILGNVSSEESIFDSALIIEGMENEDSHMYSSIMDEIYGNTDSMFGPKTSTPNKEHLDVVGDDGKVCRYPGSRCSHKLHFKSMPANVGKVETSHINSRVDSRRDQRYPDNYNRHNKDRQVRQVRRIVRPSSDGYKSIDPNIITQTVEKSLRKYQLERKLFEELHDLKRFQIRSDRSNEILMVKRLVDKFRKDVKAPGMSDFGGVYSYKNYEYYLYDQLRRLSTSNQGKVAMLSRSVSHENIQLIRDSMESITQSNPEMMQNSVGLDINQHNLDQNCGNNYSDNDRCIESAIVINENTTHSVLNNTENASLNIVDSMGGNDISSDMKLVNQLPDETSNQIDISGNNREINSNKFKSEDDYENFDRTGLGLSLDSHTAQPMEDDSRVDPCIDDIIDMDDIQRHIKKDELYQDLHISHNSEQNIEQQREQSPRLAYTRKISQTFSQDISETIISDCLNEIQHKLTHKESKDSDDSTDMIIDEIVEISDLQNDLEIIGQTVETISDNKIHKSSDSQTDQISDTKSTYGSTTRSENSLVSRNFSSKSLKMPNISNKQKDKQTKSAKQSFKKECLKPVKDLKPIERAKNRPKFKRLRTKIPMKTDINISVDDIKQRWKTIKESELKKLHILYSHQTDIELKSQSFILWFELNKFLRNTSDSSDSDSKTESVFDTQIERYIIENRNTLQKRRTLSDSHILHQNKLDINRIPIE